MLYKKPLNLAPASTFLREYLVFRPLFSYLFNPRELLAGDGGGGGGGGGNSSTSWSSRRAIRGVSLAIVACASIAGIEALVDQLLEFLLRPLRRSRFLRPLLLASALAGYVEGS